jgi:predicted dehydrogenase
VRDPSAVARVAVIGCGRIGSLWDEGHAGASPRTHAGAYQRCQRARLVALCDEQADRLHAAGQRRGIARLYLDYHRLFEQEALDLVSICTPPAQRLEVIEAALRAGVRGLFCEKPLAVDLPTALAIRETVKQYEATMGVAYLRCWNAAIEQATAWVRRGGLGQIQSLVGRYDKGLLNNGSHLLELVLRMFGLPRRVACWPSVAAAGPCGDPTPDARLEFAGEEGDFAFYMLGSDYRRFSLFELDVVGTQGRIRIHDKGWQIDTETVVEDARAPGYRMLQPVSHLTTGLDGMLSRAVEQLLDVYQQQADAPACTVDDAVQVMRVVDALLVAYQSGKPMQLKPLLP